LHEYVEAPVKIEKNEKLRSKQNPNKKKLEIINLFEFIKK